jgi:hypothetical protein
MSPPDDTAAADASLVPDARFEEPLRRVSYGAGMLLGLEATRAEQAYHRRRHTRHAYWLHGSGTVAGLRVDLQGDAPADDATPAKVRLVVTPGVGVDGLGREVSLAEPYCLDLRAWVDAQYGADGSAPAWKELLRDGLDEANALLWLAVTMRYRDVPSGLQPALAVDLNAGTDPVAPARMQDGVLLELVAERAPPGRERPFPAHLALGDLAAVKGRLQPDERRRLDAAGGGARRQLELGARLLFALGEGGDGLAPRAAAAASPAAVARTLLARVTVPLVDGRPLVNRRRVGVDNLARPFLFSASTLARLLAE